jgi:hypothetical protein
MRPFAVGQRRALQLNLRPLMVCSQTNAGQQIKPQRRSKQDKPDALPVSDGPA